MSFFAHAIFIWNEIARFTSYESEAERPKVISHVYGTAPQVDASEPRDDWPDPVYNEQKGQIDKGMHDNFKLWDREPPGDTHESRWI